MRSVHKLVALALCVCLILSLTPTLSTTAQGASAQEAEACGVTLTGNTGAVLNCSSTPLSAEVDDNELAIVEIRGNTVKVIGKDGAVGTVRLTVEDSAGYQIFDIPIGYTTFFFDGNKLTVFEGSSTGWQVTGVNAAAEEYVVGAATNPLPESVDADGNKFYENTDTYKLYVNIPKTGGTFVFTGVGTDSAIAVKKAATAPASLLLAGLDLSSSFTAPITIKKESTAAATITALAGFTNTLTDAAFNNADVYGPTEEGGDGTNAGYAESAVIKAKSNARLTVNGEGTLNLVCNTKNALKVGEYGSLTIDQVTLNVSSVKNGVSSDNVMTINGGNFQITTADGDCIRSDPDAVNAEAGCGGSIVINGGSFTLQAASDGIQAAQDLTINGGDFHITTGRGYNDSSFNKDTMSCKGLKASCNTDDTTGDETEATNQLTINGGSFVLNTADDAIHSDAYVTITGGEFNIQTGDDGVHGDTQANFGVDNGSNCAIHLTVSTSYEGLEAKNVYIDSGCYSVTASDDGINAAGGSSNGTDPGGGGWDPWNPGGPGGGDSSAYSLNIRGGLVNVNCNGDGLDSNGALNITGGSSIIWSQSPNGDNSPLDSDGTMTVNGGMVFGGGTNPMNENPSTSTSQPYVKYGRSGGGGPGGGGGGSTINAGKTVVVKNASSQTVFSIKAPKNINYAIYSSPTMTSSSGWSITADNSTPTVTNFWAEHSYGSYVQTQAPSCTVPGVRTATCSACGGTVTEEVAPTGHSFALTETVAPTATAEGYDIYTCPLCGGTYRTNFTEPSGEPDPCIDGHTWNEGIVSTEPSCTETGVKTFTCTVCGETTTQPIAALGHDFDDETGVCFRCGQEAFRASFDCSEGCSVTVFRTQDLSSGGTENAVFAFPRTSDLGTIDVSGDGQVNFLVALEEGYSIESVTVTPASNFKNLKVPSEIGTENAYRITKMTGPVSVTVTASTDVCQHEFDEGGICIHCGYEAPKVTFACDEHSWVTAYPTQDLTANGTDHADFALARNSDTGEIAIDGTGQVNFVLHIDDGYELKSISAAPATSYKNLKDNGDGSYRITKISGHLSLSVTTVSIGAPDPCVDGHTWGGGIVTTEPTCTEEGVRTFTCTVCGETKTETIPALDHDWTAPTYVWSEDNALATATRICERDNSHKETETVQTTFAVTVEPTITTTGEMTYTATFQNPAFAAQTKTVVLPKLGPTLPCDGSENCPGKVFTDMPNKGHWAHDAIDWAIVCGVTAGTSDTTFSPNKTCTRAQIVSFLWRAAGSPEPQSTSCAFTDVKSSSYYYKAVLWAVENGITAGTSDTTFSPNASCTREQVVTFLWHFAGSPEPKTTTCPFTDVKAESFSYKAILWAAENGVTAGTSETTFSPKQTCTRAQIVTFLWRCINKE